VCTDPASLVSSNQVSIVAKPAGSQNSPSHRSAAS
jgi:hypothetical protein